jgi:hypothetical protein
MPSSSDSAPGQRAVLPWFAGRDSRMIWREAPAVEPSPWGVLQPAAEAEALAPDTMLVPLVAADRRGTRIGHGKGHYDRALAHLRQAGPVFTIGLAWEPQIARLADRTDEWDVPLDAIATPEGVDRLPMNRPEPSWRKPFGIFLILSLIAAWAVIVATRRRSPARFALAGPRPLLPRRRDRLDPAPEAALEVDGNGTMAGLITGAERR